MPVGNSPSSLQMQDSCSTVVGSVGLTVGGLVAVDIELFPCVPSGAERVIRVRATRSRFIGKLENVKCWFKDAFQFQKHLGNILCLTVPQTRLVMLIDGFSCLL